MKRNYTKKDSFLDIEKSSEESSEKITRLIKSNNKISAKELSQVIWISSRAVEKQIKNLKESWIIKRIWANKWGYWKVLSK